MLAERIEDIQRGLHTAALIQAIAIRNAVNQWFAALLQTAVYLLLEHTELDILEMLIDSVLREAHLSTQELFCQIELMLDVVVYLSEVFLLLLELLDSRV